MSFFQKLFSTLTSSERKAAAVAVAAGIIALAVVVIAVFVATTKAVPAAGGDFTEGMVGQPEYVNPVTAVSETDRSLVRLVYVNLPEIADSITTSTDGKTWTVRLKPGLTWQDGEKLTSDDVIFTVQSIQNPDTASPLSAAWQGIAVSRASELELSFTLAEPYAFFADTLSNLYILPKHLFASVPPGNWRFSQYNLKPVGAGPYQFVSYDSQSSGFIGGYHLGAWNGFAGAQALIQNFDLSFFGSQSDTVKAFNTGAIDGFAATPDDLVDVKRPAQIIAWPTTSYYAVFFNQGNNTALADAAVREALSETVDRSALVSSVLQNYGEPDEGPIPPDAADAIGFAQTNLFDAAAGTLTADGWQLNAEGVRQKTIQGVTTTLSFTLTVPDNPALIATAQVLQATWQSLGIPMTIASDTPENIAANQVVNRSYDAILYGNTLNAGSDLYAFWNSAERFAPGENLSLYGNATDDGLMASIRTTMNDASRTAMSATLQNDIVAANPAVFLYSPDDLYVSGKTIYGATTSTPLTDPSDRFAQIPQWYLGTTRVLK